MTEPKKGSNGNNKVWHPVDWVALVLAMALGLNAVLILIISAIQITRGSFPQVQLSENATQILIAVSGGLVGLLGAYIGGSRGKRPSSESGVE